MTSGTQQNSGGAAAAGGIRFQAEVGALLATHALAEWPLEDEWGWPGETPTSLYFETSAPVDDILVETSGGHRIYMQAKTRLDRPALASCFSQAVRLLVASRTSPQGGGAFGPLELDSARVVFVTSENSPQTIRTHLPNMLGRARAAPSLASLETTFPNQDERDVFAVAKDAIFEAFRQAGASTSDEDAHLVLKLVRVVSLVIGPGGADRRSAVTQLGRLTANPKQAEAALDVLIGQAEEYMRSRSGGASADWRTRILAAGIPLAAPPSFRSDVQRIRDFSNAVLGRLRAHEALQSDGVVVRVERQSVKYITDAAESGHLLIIGEPGAGKSGAMAAAADILAKDGAVVALAVDELAVSDLDSLRTAIGLQNPLADVLSNVSSTRQNYLFIDALDASRGGPSEQAIVALISRVMDGVANWTVVASVREFDLRLGKRFQTAFRGAPPIKEAASANFPNVRHVHVPLWTEQEFASLCLKAPKLNNVVTGASAALADVLRVPFNTRLVAELVDAGIAPSTFHAVGGQVELLDLYWRERVQHLGPSADAAAQTALKSMVDRHELRCDASVVAAVPGHETVFRINLLVLVTDGRFAAFRHHLLFDYAVSRYLLNPESQSDFQFWIDRNREAGLLLGPGCTFTLARLWSKSQGDRSEFWRVCLDLGGHDKVDPIIRVVAGRSAAQLPHAPDDVDAAIALLSASPSAETAKGLRTIVSSLISLADDEQPRAPWVKLGLALLQQADDFIYSARALLMWALRKDETSSDPAAGLLARGVLNKAVSTNAPSLQIIVPAIEAVSKTYTTDATQSRNALEQLLDRSRLASRAHEEIPWLARQIGTIAFVDPAFAVRVYGVAFDHEVEESRETPMGDSQILPLRSNTRQDYQMSRWSLVESFPKFLESQPGYAIDALIAAVRGTVRREHPLPDGAGLQHIAWNGAEYPFQEDLSYIWASNPHDPHAHYAEKMLQQYVAYLKAQDASTTRALISAALPRIEFAVIWARTFMVAASSYDMALDLFDLAKNARILHCNDTKKDAIDVLGVVLAKRSQTERDAVLAEIAAHDYSIYKDPHGARESVERRLQSVIQRGSKAPERVVDPDLEETEDQPNLVDEDEDSNSRLVRYSSWSGRSDDEWWWLSREGVDVKEEPNASLLSASKALSDFLESIKDDPTEDIAVDIAKRITALIASREAGTDAAEYVLNYVDDVLARAAGKIIDADAAIKWPALRAKAREALFLAAGSTYPRIDDVEADNKRDNISWSSPAARLEAAQGLISLARFQGEADDDLRQVIERLLEDDSSAVRDQVAVRLSYLWDIDRNWMWDLADRVAAKDKSTAVLKYFASTFIPRVINSEPAKAEALVTILAHRAGATDAKPSLRNDIATLSAWLWIGHASVPSGDRIEAWLSNVSAHSEELEDIIQFLRADLVTGLGENDAKKDRIRSRTLDLARRALAAAADVLSRHIASPDSSPEGMERARSCAKLIDTIGMQLYFAFLPRGERGTRTPQYPASLFLTETKPILTALAEHGTPHTTHHLLELLEELVDSAPEEVWDIIAGAILTGGKRHGYTNESMGVDLYVRLVGRYLADHKGIFDNPQRRKLLLETLEAFIEMGWPSARKLLNELPDLLR